MIPWQHLDLPKKKQPFSKSIVSKFPLTLCKKSHNYKDVAIRLNDPRNYILCMQKNCTQKYKIFIPRDWVIANHFKFKKNQWNFAMVMITQYDFPLVSVQIAKRKQYISNPKQKVSTNSNPKRNEIHST